MFQQRKNRFQQDVPLRNVRNIIKAGRAIPFPWDAIPNPVRSWLEAMAGAVNTQAEFLLLGAMTVTSSLMGPECFFEVGPRHREPCNIFTVCLCAPGTGKTQAYQIAVEKPLEGLDADLLVHDYTEKGLFKCSRGGRAILCHAEMTSFFEHILKCQTDGASERQMFSRFHDGNSKLIRTSHGRSSKNDGRDERQVLEKVSLSVGGFCQPQPYINLHQMLSCSDDGFLDRIGICIVNSMILKESEIHSWNEVLDTFNISEFDGEFIYTRFIVMHNFITKIKSQRSRIRNIVGTS
jgi:hypothetical protein